MTRDEQAWCLAFCIGLNARVVTARRAIGLHREDRHGVAVTWPDGSSDTFWAVEPFEANLAIRHTEQSTFERLQAMVVTRLGKQWLADATAAALKGMR